MHIRPDRSSEHQDDCVSSAKMRIGFAALEIPHQSEHEDPTENVRSGKPVQVGGGQHGRSEQTRQEEISTYRPVQPDPQPGDESDGHREDPNQSTQAGQTEYAAHDTVRSPLPGNPGLP